MILGDPMTFAIESKITRAYAQLSFRGLGFFVIFVNENRYGVNTPDATMLACSFDKVERRIADRGRHIAPFATELNAGEIADSFRNAIYAEKQNETYFGIPLREFKAYFGRRSSDLMWAPDGDEAFEDGSYVLQFDVGNQVRLIAFKCNASGQHDPSTLSDLWLPQEEYYRVLQQWLDAFNAERATMLKVPNFHKDEDRG